MIQMPRIYNSQGMIDKDFQRSIGLLVSSLLVLDMSYYCFDRRLKNNYLVVLMSYPRSYTLPI